MLRRARQAKPAARRRKPHSRFEVAMCSPRSTRERRRFFHERQRRNEQA